MIQEENIYREIIRINKRKRDSEANLLQLRQVKEQKLLNCDRKRIEAIEEYISNAEPLLGKLEQDSFQLLQLENRAMSSVTPLIDTIRELKVHYNQKFDALDQKLSEQNFQLTRLRNLIQNKEGEMVESVPFLDGTWPDDYKLPEIKNIPDIDRLSEDQCRQFLTGYGVSFTDNETYTLKEKLRDAIGFTLIRDITYSFCGSDTE